MICFVAFVLIAVFSSSCYGQTNININWDSASSGPEEARMLYDVIAQSETETDDPDDNETSKSVTQITEGHVWQESDPPNPDRSDADVTGAECSIGPMSGVKLRLSLDNHYGATGVKNEAECATLANQAFGSDYNTARTEFAFDSDHRSVWDQDEEGTGPNNTVLTYLELECWNEGNYDVLELDDGLTLEAALKAVMLNSNGML